MTDPSDAARAKMAAAKKRNWEDQTYRQHVSITLRRETRGQTAPIPNDNEDKRLGAYSQTQLHSMDRKFAAAMRRERKE